MRWIRQHIRGCAGLALAALALHFVLTFGHVHLEEFAGSGPGPAAVTAAVSAGDGGAAGNAPTHSHHVDYLCAVCVTITMLATSIPPLLHRLAPPRLLAVAVAEFAATARPCQPHLRFQARAPPLA